MFKFKFAVAVFGSLVSVRCYGQEFRGSLTGRVMDPTGAVIAAAKVNARNVATNVANGNVSNGSGNYQLLFLIPGRYEITVEAAGFKRLERSGVEINADSRTSLDLTLEVGAATDSVSVAADAPLLETSSPDLARTVTTEFVERMDFSLNRNATTLAALAPGVTGTAGGTYTASTAIQISINGGGGRRGANEYEVDGIPNMTTDGSVVFTPSLDSVAEFVVHNTMFDASLGHSNGGAISITTRSGTNDLHGTGYAYRRLTWMQARGWTANKFNQPKANSNYIQGGYQVSGPIVIPKIYNGRNRTFFTNSFEKDDDSRPLTQQFRVPTALERKGDFSQTLNKSGGKLAIYDPYTTVGSGANVTRQAFPNAIVPSNRLDPTGLAVLNLFPLPNIPGAPQIGVANWFDTSTYDVKQLQYLGRLDQYVTAKNRIFFRYGQENRDQDVDRIFYVGSNCGNCGHQRLQYTNIGFDDTYTFSPSMIGDFRIGFTRGISQNRRGADGLDPAQIALPGAIVSAQYEQGFPTFTLGESFPMFGSLHPRNANNLGSLVATATKLRGNHSVKFGVDYRLGRSNLADPGANAFGNFTFNNTFTRSNPFTASTGNTSGTAIASVLLGIPASGQVGYTSPVALQNHYLALYAQDEWRVNPKLTLNIGLRWEIETPYTERYNRETYGFDTNAKLPITVPNLNLTGGVLFTGTNGNSRTGGRIDGNNFGPRFGFAYQLAKRTVVRGGYGIFYSAITNNDNFHGQIGTFDASTSYVGTADSGATPLTTIRNPFPNGLTPVLGSTPGLLAQAGNSLTTFALDRVNPYNQQWQFSVQHQLPARVLVEAAYLGLQSIHTAETFDLNELPDRYLSLGPALSDQVPNPFLGVLPTTSTLGQGATISQSQLLVRYPQYTSVILEGAPTGRAIYHALQLKVDKRITHGLSVIGSYTFSRIMTSNTTSLVNERHYRSVGQYDQKHYARIAFVYQLPYHWQGSFAKRALDAGLGGWELSGHYVVFTGLPLTVTDSNGRPLRIAPVAKSGDIESRLGDKTDANGNVLNPYFNINAFQSLPSQYVVTPELPYLDELRAPTERSLNLLLAKNFRIRENIKAQFNIEADDALNSPLFDAPGTDFSNKATFGVIRSDHGGRSVQMSVRFRF